MRQYDLHGDIFLNITVKKFIDFDTMNWGTITALRTHFDKETKIVLLIEGIFMVRY